MVFPRVLWLAERRLLLSLIEATEGVAKYLQSARSES